MNYNKLSRSELVRILERITEIVSKTSNSSIDSNKYSNFNSNENNDVVGSNTDLENLIGTIPFLLLNEKIFKKNLDIVDFAMKLGIYIPSADKKKKEDIIGRIIVFISKFDKFKIAELNRIIKSLKTDSVMKNKSNFFKDWDNAIKNMQI